MSTFEDRLSAPRIPIATVSDHNALLEAIRQRVAELDVSYDVIESIAGIQSGCPSKVIANPPPKRIGPFTYFLILQALGCELQMVENPQEMERLRSRLSKRKLRRTRVRPAASIIELAPDFYARISRMGNAARNTKLSPERRSELARNAALARWHRPLT